MKYSIFNKNKTDALKQPMFFGASVNVARYDQRRYEFFEKLTEKQLSFFWRPEEIDITKDKIDFEKLLPNERHIFISNLQYQTLLDSIQGRSPNVAFLPVVSLPEVENWIETWAFSETIHSRSYTHIIQGIVNNPTTIFDEIMDSEEIIKRSTSVSQYYDDFIEYSSFYNLFGAGKHKINGEIVDVSLSKLKEKLYLTMMSVNILEAIRFYVSFACSFAFAERKLMEGNSKIIKLIARDEALHLSGTQYILNAMRENKCGDEEMADIAKSCEKEVETMFIDAINQEKQWADYLFRDGSMIGLNANILKQYLEYISYIRMNALSMKPPFEKRPNPLPWINHWLDSDNVQVAPQETEITSYLTSSIDNNINNSDFSNFEL